MGTGAMKMVIDESFVEVKPDMTPHPYVVVHGGVSGCVRECLLREGGCVQLLSTPITGSRSSKCTILSEASVPLEKPTEDSTILGSYNSLHNSFIYTKCVNKPYAINDMLTQNRQFYQ